MDNTQALKFYYERLSDLYRNQCVSALLGWDMNVLMPPFGAQARADQEEYMSLLFHKQSTDPEFAKIVDSLYENKDNLPENDQVSVRLSKRSLDIQRKLPEDFIKELSQTCSLSYNAWVKARPANDFAATKPYLEKLVELAKRRSELLGYVDHPYDPLLDEYDPGAKTAEVRDVLLELGSELSAILPLIVEKSSSYEEPDAHYPQPAQNALCRKVSNALGLNFDAARIDISPHPFMTSIGPSDIRITTRYEENDFRGALFGIIHETGHALYEMGLPEDYHKNPPMGSPLSSSIHESQSRLWENLVGRSKEFSVYLSRVMAEFFPKQAASLTPERLWQYANKVKPSLIRTEADEVTYSLHVVVRLLLELDLITGSLAVADLPDAWNSLYEKYLGIRPPNDKNGVMQDIHWFQGSFGYFPTYALGNLYNAMMMDSAREAIPGLPGQIENGEFAPLLAWLRENVHKHGMRYSSPELIRRITGKDLSAKPFVEYLKRKHLQ